MPDLEWPAEIPPLVAAALDAAGAGSIIFGNNLLVLRISDRLKTLLGLPPDKLLHGASLISVIQESSAIDAASRTLWARRLLEIVDGSDNAAINISGADRSLSLTLETRRIGDEHWISTFEDVTSRRQAESQLVSLALKDALTGLANRSCFEQSLASALTRSSPTVAVMLVDLDRFKAVNDTLGHATGDGVLRLVGQRLQSAVRELDVIARLGGDEFAILFTQELLRDEVSALAGRVVNLLQRTYLVAGNVVNIGASAGIAVAPQDGATAERLLRSADLALYQSKAAGRNRFHFFHPAMEERAQQRRNLELDLRKALPLRQMEVHYKPQVDVATKDLLGFEAMLRWRHPSRGLVDAEEFAPLCDELGLTVQMGDWMLRTACRDAAQWPDHLAVSVGTSPRQFETGRLVESVKCALAASSQRGSRLEITITEDILLRNEQNVLGMLHDLRALGARVAMDSFGTGYASLRQLASFPFDRVNINRSLLDDRNGNARHRAIVKAIASLGASLGISTTAEGIETAAELDQIHSDGCNSMRGYLPSRGVPASELPILIAGLEEMNEQHCL